MKKLTADERETIISVTDTDERVYVYSSQKRRITQLINNPSFVEDERVMLGKNIEAVRGTLPLNGFGFRGGQRKEARVTATGNDSKRKRRQGTLCGATKADGSICQMIASKETGRCRWHGGK